MTLPTVSIQYFTKPAFSVVAIIESVMTIDRSFLSVGATFRVGVGALHCATPAGGGANTRTVTGPSMTLTEAKNIVHKIKSSRQIRDPFLL